MQRTDPVFSSSSFLSSGSIWHPFTQHGFEEQIVPIVRAEGAYMYTQEEKCLIDAISSWWVITHGHCHPRIVEALQRYAPHLDQVIFAGYTHEAAEELALRLKKFLPFSLGYIFFSDSGSTSVEVAVKMALGYFQNTGRSRNLILTMEDSYHGDTVGGMSLGARSVFNHAYEPLLFSVGRIPFPEAGQEHLTLDALENLCQQGRAAALILEPLILGAGGMRVYPPWVLKVMAEICARHEVLLIADEVMTGWGRTGTVFACEQAGVTPDILCSSKGLTGGALPLAITACRGEIFAAHYAPDPQRTFFHSSSFTANPLACRAAIANLAIWEETDVLAQIATLTKRQAEYAEKCQQDSRFEKVRQIGTIVAMDFKSSNPSYGSLTSVQLRKFFRESGIVLRPLGKTIYVLPPYCTRAQDLEKIYESIGEAADFLSVSSSNHALSEAYV